MYRVLEGGLPDRPSPGFSDQLWELLVGAWSVEHGSQPSKRPPVATIRDLLREDARNWGRPIAPLTPARAHNRRRRPMYPGGSVIDTASERLEVNGGCCS